MLIGCVRLQPELLGLVTVSKTGRLEALQESAVHWPSRLKACVAVCNSLNLVNRHEVMGDLADYTAFQACEARFLVRPLPALLSHTACH